MSISETNPRSPVRDLLAWQRAMDLVDEVYELSRRFPSGEQFGLTKSDPTSCGLDPFEHRRGLRPIQPFGIGSLPLDCPWHFARG